ncbi:MAG: type II toxin-antitoxin system RelE/ParE family toxin [Burkholderiales bacterium]
MLAKKRLEWAPRAGRDLLAIEDFYADFSQITADRVISEIRRSALRLETYPAIGRPGQVRGTRELVITSYPFILVYRVTGSRVRVGRVLHQHQKYPD